ncbi:Bacteriophage P2-related tail formation protein [Serratia fonticola]|uniref:phage tail protein I n=1 Tax=Serratia fonticola TaxID=47917 RepID=UPI0021832875|nr:phage tail protein I [Serratia fonticola]CAI2121088.1 Bacteriophage P2-related tail formation protein [Serratia fonticola]
MNSLLPTGSTLLERNAAEACAGISDLKVPLRDLWNPDKCPVKFLPYLAWAFSVDRWDEKWSAAEKRKAVKDAFYIHRRKGTVAAIRRVIENLGYSMSITEWWQVADPAGTFRLSIDVNDIGITDEIVNELERLIGDAKPVSRHIAQLSLSVSTAGIINIGAAVCNGEVITVYPLGYEYDESIYYDGLTNYDGEYYFYGEQK